MRRVLATAVLCCACRGADPPPAGPTGLSTGVAPTMGIVAGVPTGTASGEPVRLPRYDGDLDAVRDAILGERMAERDSDLWTPTGPAERADLAELARRLADGDLAVAGLAASVGYEALLARDEVNDRDVVVVWETEPWGHRGALLVGLGPARPVVFESPHPVFDSRTGAQGFELFVGLGARAWLVSTAHRCASGAPTACDGSSSVCTGVSEAYRESDAAHNTASAFQALHEGLLDADPALVAVQVHGFAWSPGDPDAFVSQGSTAELPSSGLANRLASELDGRGVDAASCSLAADASVVRLCGTTNTQGRHANGSGEPCGTAAPGATGRFLHVEQSSSLRQAGSPLQAALDAVLP